MLRKISYTIAFLFVASGAGCLGSAPTSEPTSPNPAPVGDPASTGGGNTGGTTPTDPTLGTSPTTGGTPDNTFDHESNQTDPFEVLGRIQEQGAPEVSSRMHSCQKLKYATLGAVLKQLGVNLAKTGTPPSAGQLYAAGAGALGAPSYGARLAESIELTTAGATKLFDIFVQAAPEVIAAMPTNAACMVAGQATSMFDAQGACTIAGIACLQGAPATQAQKDLCDQVLTEASSPAIGKTIAVATILAAQHTCE
jgi:hypothetical protein